MSLNLLNSFGAKGVNYGLYTEPADVIDTEYLSRYFVVSEFNPTFTSGKNSISVNGSAFLVSGGEILVECIDSTGNPLYIELAKYSETNKTNTPYKESTAYVFSIYVFNDTNDGVGKLTLYGTLIDGRTVKWTQNITINKALKNDSRVRFYQAPILDVTSAEVPVLGSDISLNLVDSVNFTGKLTGLAVTPPKDTNLATLNKRNTDIDYRLILTNPIVDNSTLDSAAFNSQMIGGTITLYVNTIQSPLSLTYISVSQTSSYIVTNVLDNHTIQIGQPYYYNDGNGNESVTNIVDANFSIEYPFVNYNNATASYQTTVIGGITYIVKQSYADITYRNIRTFSGYVARHKIYRKSLLSNGDFSVIADEPITPNEILSDDLTQNKYYDLLGKFYNSDHISRYWFTSSTNLSLSHTPYYAIDSMQVSSPNTSLLNGGDYFIVKNDSSTDYRNAQYIPYIESEYLAESGSSYDANFMALKSNVQYIVEINAVINKQPNESNASLAFYFTSSVDAATQEQNYTTTHGIKIAEISTAQSGSIINFTDTYAFFTPKSDLYGTLVVVPKYCTAYIKNISVRVYGDDGYSPDAFTTRIPWPISVANESFQIKAELFDINSNLIYSDLNTFHSFDPSGSTLIPYVPGGGGYADLHVSGTLYVSQSAIIENGTVYIPNITPRPGIPDISQSRMLSVRADGAIVFDPIVDITSDSEYLYLSLGDSSNRLLTTITTRKSITSEYGSLAGRKIYWVTGSKVIETTP